MGPRGPPGPAGAPVSIGFFLLESGDTDAFKLSDVSSEGGQPGVLTLLFRDLKDFKATLVNLGNPVFL